MAAQKKKTAPKRERHDLYLRLTDKGLKPRVQKLSDKMGYQSTNRIGEVALAIGVAVMERPEYWSARLDGVTDEEIAKYIIDGLKAREEKKRKR